MSQQQKPVEKTTPVTQQAAQGPGQAPAAQKKKERVETPLYKYYEIKGDTVNRLRRECPRCGKGTFLADHKDRLTCGKCGYTSYKKATR